MQRRDFLALLAAAGAGVAQAAARFELAAAWRAGSGDHVGVLARSRDGLRVSAAIDVPTRAHGLLVEREGTLLAVARRPGDWLLRWHADGRAQGWAWIEPDRAFNGHVIASPDGGTLYTTETRLDTGMGLVGVRDAKTLAKRAEWHTHGLDPHELVLDADGTLLVANGGIPTQPETGRQKLALDRMDPSLARLSVRDGALLGQWRLDDPRLSIRHLAWNGRLLGVALQAEHDDPVAKANAPVLAVFDGQALRSVERGSWGAGTRDLAGYGGDIAAGDGLFAVSCPRAQGVAMWHADGRWARFVPLDEACALARIQGALWAGGRSQAVGLQASGEPLPLALSGLRLDNHWVPMPSA